MERLKIRYLTLILLLCGCQILEVTNNESIELIPDLSVPINKETVEANQLVEVANIEPSVPEIISIWEVLKNEAVIKISKVIHLAAQAGVRYSIYKPSVYLDTNILGFFNILDISKKYKIKHFLFSSSSSVYGDQKKYPIKESVETSKPLSFYAAIPVYVYIVI